MPPLHKLPSWIKTGLLFDIFLITSWLSLWYLTTQLKDIQNFQGFHKVSQNLELFRFIGLYGAAIYIILILSLLKLFGASPLFFINPPNGFYKIFPEPTLLTNLIIVILALLINFYLGALLSLLFTKFKNPTKKPSLSKRLSDNGFLSRTSEK